MNFPALFTFHFLQFFLLESSKASLEVSRDIQALFFSHLQLLDDGTLLCLTMIFIFSHGPANVETEEDEDDEQEGK